MNIHFVVSTPVFATLKSDCKCFSIVCLSLLWMQSGPQDQKSVTFSHSVISLNQLLQNSINTAYIFLTFRNHVKIFLCQNILHNVSNVVYCKNLSIRTNRSDKTVKALIRLLLEEQSDQDLHCFSFYLLHLHIILQGKPKLFNFRIFSILISVVPIFRRFHLKNC